MAIVPEVAAKLARTGVDVVVQSGAGAGARFPDDAFVAAGATVVPEPPPALAGRRRRGPGAAADRSRRWRCCPRGSRVVSFLQPVASTDVVGPWPPRAPPSTASTCCPGSAGPSPWTPCRRRPRCRATGPGWPAAEHLAKFFPMFMTAAGTVPPAKVLVMGAGVAGLQAIATARRLGAVVRAYDVRAAAKEEVAEPRAPSSWSSTSRPRTAPAATPGSSRPSTWPSSRSCWPPRWPPPTWSSPPPRSPAARHRCW